MKVTFVPIVIGAFGTVTKGLLKGLEDLEVGGRMEDYWRRPEYWEESWRLEETCCHSNSREKPNADSDVKNSKRVYTTTTNNNNNRTTKMKKIIVKNLIGRKKDSTGQYVSVKKNYQKSFSLKKNSF